MWNFLVINGSDFINNPWNITVKAFTDLFGSGFYLIPISFIAVALYLKTRNPVTVSAFLLGSGILLSSGSIFMDYPEMGFVYTIFTILGLVGLILSIYFTSK